MHSVSRAPLSSLVRRHLSNFFQQLFSVIFAFATIILGQRIYYGEIINDPQSSTALALNPLNSRVPGQEPSGPICDRLGETPPLAPTPCCKKTKELLVPGRHLFVPGRSAAAFVYFYSAIDFPALHFSAASFHSSWSSFCLDTNPHVSLRQRCLLRSGRL